MLHKLTLNGKEKINKQQCPLMNFSNHLVSVPSDHVLSSISVVHECSRTCQLLRKTKTYQIERENIELDTLVLKHDTKTLFALNVYCLNSYYYL